MLEGRSFGPLDAARKKLANLSFELKRRDNDLPDKLLRISQRGVGMLRTSPHVDVSRRLIFELTKAPKPFRGMKDFVIRRGTERDVGPLSTIDATAEALVRSRLARGELAYVGELEGDVLCHTWFHPGPTPCEEDRDTGASWALDATTFWSYNGASKAEARSTGVFVKLFQNALHEIFEVHGARRVHGFIHDTNRASITMHERLGFTCLGALVVVAVPGFKWLRWDGSGRSRQWVVRRSRDFAIAFPPS